MPKKEWRFILDNKQYVVKIEHGIILKRFHLTVNGETIKPTDNVLIKKGNKLSFKISNHNCAVLVLFNNYCEFDYDLIIDEQSITTGKKVEIPEETDKKEKKGIIKTILAFIGVIFLYLIDMIISEIKLLNDIFNAALVIVLIIIAFRWLQCYLKHRE